MDEQERAALLDELAAEAGRQREAFLGEAGRSFVDFLEANKARIRELGGLVLIDDEPDYLFIGEDGTFRSRTRYRDEAGRWVAETEDIEDGAELVEIFNPADIYASFVDAAEAEAAGEGAAAEPGAGVGEGEPGDETEADAGADEADEADEEAALDEDWSTPLPAPETKEEAARMLYDLALTFQERSQWREAQLLDDFHVASGELARMLGDHKIVEDEDERIWFRSSGTFEGEVVPEEDEEGNPVWRTLSTPDDFVLFYDPTDLFGDLAEAIAKRYPDAAPEFDDEDEADEDEADERSDG